MHGAYIMRLYGGQVCFVLLLGLSCVMARPSDAAEEARDLHSSPGFKPYSYTGYDGSQDAEEMRIPVRVIFSDEGNKHKKLSSQPEVQTTTAAQTEQPTQQTSTTSTMRPEVVEEVKEPSEAENENRQNVPADLNKQIEPRIGSTNSGVRNQNFQRQMTVISNSQGGRNIHVRVKSPFEVFKSEGNGEEKEEKSKNKDVNKKGGDKVNLKEPEETDDDTVSEEEQLVQSKTSQPFFNNRPFSSPLENPILTYLTKQQALERDNSNSEAVGIDNKPQQNVRREVFHQQTIINPNPYMQQFLQQLQQSNPAYYQNQAQNQQFSPAPQYIKYQTQSNFPGNNLQRIENIQGQQQQEQQQQQQLYPKLTNTNMNIAGYQQQQFASPDGQGNMLTSLTLYPALASVMYSTPSAGPSNYQNIPTQYPQSFGQGPFPNNVPNTRIFYNGMQPMSRVNWPFANYFPIVIKDPFLSMYNMFSNMVEYGPEADVCKKSKTFRQGRSRPLILEAPELKSEEETAGRVIVMENGGWRVIGKDESPYQMARNMPEEEEQVEEDRKKKADAAEIVMESGGNGNAGPYITRLMVRKGGVSIAGPGGIATAGSGGTAIVGPGGVAYTSPNGLAVVGPGGKVIGLPSGTDLASIATQVANPTGSNSEGSTPRFINIPPGGRVVAHGPIVYYHPPE